MRGAFPEDLVQIVATGDCALVTRSWIDEQSPEFESATAHLPGVNALPAGMLELLRLDGKRSVFAESDLQVIDRTFLVGDILRPAVTSPTPPYHPPGVLLEQTTLVKLQRVLSKQDLPGQFNAKDVVGATRVLRGDIVLYGSWVGLVEECFAEALVKNSPLTIKQAGSFLAVGLKDVALPPTTNSGLHRAIFGPTPSQEPIINVTQTILAVNWLCISQLAGPESQNQVRPKRFWSDIDSLSLVRATSDHLHSYGDNVVFRDRTSPHAQPSPLDPTLPIDGQSVLVITHTSTTVKIKWQDGTTSEGPSADYELSSSLDEDNDVFPGDVGVYTPTGKVGITQKMDARKGTVVLRWYGEGEETETVSALEFDANGPPPEIYGVRRQDKVLITRSTGMTIPTVGRLGESELLTGMFPSGDELRTALGHVSDSLPIRDPLVHRGLVPKTGAELADVNWFGEVVDLCLNGQALVEFPSGRREKFPLDQIYLLDDGMEEAGLMEGEEVYASDDEMMQDQDGWEDEEYDPDEEDVGWADDSLVLDPEAPEVEDIVLETEEVALPVETNGAIETEDDPNWKRFEILEEAPPDHHYITESIQTPSRAFMSRIAKEFAVLASLPSNILVRAYENRSDLLRCLIIGPASTPFADAPFLFDLYLSPTKFPNEPPLVHFHSLGGTRISPNLYSEGKVCVSLLNTWQGQSTSEMWSATKSSILQIFISIQSLIMVEAPYFTEPGFEKHTSPEALLLSSAYSERTYVLARAFIKRALDYPTTDYRAEIEAYYLTGLSALGGVGRLSEIVQQIARLLEESVEYYKGGEDLPEGKSRILEGEKILSEGACLSLRRTHAGLVEVLEKHQKKTA